jgi:hypothetical protein
MYLISSVVVWNAVSMHRYVAVLSWVETGSEAVHTCLLYVHANIPDNKGKYVKLITHLRRVPKTGKLWSYIYTWWHGT